MATELGLVYFVCILVPLYTDKINLQCDNMVPGGENGIFLRVHAGKPKSDGCMRCRANCFVNLNLVQ